MPSRESLKVPCACICVTATYAFQYDTGPSAVNVSLSTPSSPYAGGMTSGVLWPSMLVRGSYFPGPQELRICLTAGETAGDSATIAPGSSVVFGQPSSRCPIPGAKELSTVEWQSAHVIPTRTSESRPLIVCTCPARPTTELSLSRVTVVAGLVRSTLPATMASFTLCGSASASTLRPTESAVAGLTALWMTSCMRSVSVQYFSSPYVSNRKMSFPAATSVGSSASTFASVGVLFPQETAIPAATNAPTTAS